MKLLFVLYYLGKSHSIATTNIVFRLTKELTKMGVDCHAIGPHSYDEDLMDIPEVTMHPFVCEATYYDKHIQQHFVELNDTTNFLKNKLKKIGIMAKHPVRSYRQIRNNLFVKSSNVFLQAYANNIQQLTENEHFDAVVGVYFPIEVMKALGQITINTPIFLYQMDPWALHESEYPDSHETRTAQEMQAFEKATHIFTTRPLYNQYSKNEFKKHISKMSVLEFPNLVDELDESEKLIPFDFPNCNKKFTFWRLVYKPAEHDCEKADDIEFILKNYRSKQPECPVYYYENSHIPTEIRTLLEQDSTKNIKLPNAASADDKDGILLNLETFASKKSKPSTTFVYTGFINDDFRSPEYFLKVFDIYLQKEPNAHLYAIGHLESNILQAYADSHSDNVALMKPLNSKLARQALNSADILVNIGNAFTNQVPSKIMDYYSTGKPIISTLKVKNCASCQYLEKYPLNLLLNEWDDPSLDAEKLFAFCKKIKGASISFEQVQNLFKESTPEFVAKQIYDTAIEELK